MCIFDVWWHMNYCNGSVFFFLSNLRLDHVLSYLRILSYSSLDLCLVLCTLPPLMSYSLALSSTMMSCTVHSPTGSLAQPTCILVYRVQSNTRRLPIQALFGFTLKQSSPALPSLSESLVWWFVLGLPWVASIIVSDDTVRPIF